MLVSYHKARPGDPLRRIQRAGTLPARHVFLLFDVSYGPANLPILTRLLDSAAARANWFLTGEWATKHSGAARRLAARGDLIGNHTWSHRNLRELPPVEMRREIARGRDAIANATGKSPSWLRPPFGESNDSVAAEARELGQRIVKCTVDSLDWHSFGPPACMEHIVRSGLDGAAVALHACADHAPAVLEALLEELARQGFRTATVDPAAGL